MGTNVERARELLAAHDPAAEVSAVPDRVVREVAAGRAMTPGPRPGPGRRHGLRLGIALAAAGAVGAAAVLGLPGDGGGEGPGGVVAGAPHADDVLPSVTSTDWVTYADQVVVARPTAERELPASAEEIEAGEGYIGRAATLTVDEVLWTRTGAPTAPGAVDMNVAGWLFKDGQRRAFAVPDSPRLEKGHTYIIALARLDDGTWSALGSEGVLPYDNAVIGNGESQGTVTTAPAAESGGDAEPGGDSASGRNAEESVESRMNGKSAQDLVNLLKTTPPDPAAAPYTNLPPEQRYAKTHEDG
ncbi:hypothetical protein [Streptomyces sp. NPDC059452]|uniref:hypothetical protein n=1 Tax=Streptomyces sp. NPDC059452 TaxID=3346835 RepID=UPI0036BA256C